MTATTTEDPVTKEISKRYYQDYDSLTDAQKLKSGTKKSMMLDVQNMASQGLIQRQIQNNAWLVKPCVH